MEGMEEEEEDEAMGAAVGGGGSLKKNWLGRRLGRWLGVVFPRIYTAAHSARIKMCLAFLLLHSARALSDARIA